MGLDRAEPALTTSIPSALGAPPPLLPPIPLKCVSFSGSVEGNETARGGETEYARRRDRRSESSPPSHDTARREGERNGEARVGSGGCVLFV